MNKIEITNPVWQPLFGSDVVTPYCPECWHGVIYDGGKYWCWYCAEHPPTIPSV